MKWISLIFVLSMASSALAGVPKGSVKIEGAKDAQLLRSIAFNNDHVLSTRWQAFLKLVKSQGKGALKDVQRALNHKEWFMRDVGIKSLMMISPTTARLEALKLLKNDPSLIVRTSAVEVFKLLKSKKNAQQLWTALEDKKNFRRDQSLWIRPRIVSTLIELKDKNLSAYAGLLNDKDPKVQKLVIHAFEKFSKHRAQYSNQKHTHKLAYWQSWWKKNSIN